MSSAVVTVAHAIRGRARLRLARLRDDAPFGAALDAVLRAVPGVTSVRLAAGAGCVVVEFDPDAIGLHGLVEVAGSDVLAAAPQDATRALAARAADGDGGSRKALYLSSAGMLLAVASGNAVALLAYPFILATSVPIFRRAWHSVARRRRLNVDLLDSLAVVAAVATGDVLNAAGIVWLVCLGDHIRDLTQARARRAIRELLTYEQGLAWVVRGDAKVQIPVAELVVGDVVVVYTGSTIPVDGRVVSGEATVDQQALTGESVPVVKTVGAHCFAATTIQDGKLYLEAERVGGDTKAASTVRLIEGAPIHETRAQNYAELFADRLVGPSLGCAGLVLAATADMNRVAAILTIDFGTGPRVSAPTTVLASMNAAARRGVLIKGGAYLEKLATISTVIFDKTGTLTRGAPEITDLLIHDDRLTEEEAMTLAAAASARQTHPVSRAVTRLAEARALSIPDREGSRYLIGRGVEARVGGRLVQLGNARLLDERGVVSRLDDERRCELEGQAKSLLHLAVDGEHVATMAHRDEIRPESRALIRELRARGIHDIVMLTGDSHAVAAQVALELGITRFFAEMLPEGKAEMAQRLKQEGGTVAVVGDGINDSPALSYADLGVSVCTGAEIAREMAGVVLVEDNLLKLVEAIDLARGATGLIKQNFALIFGANALAYGLSIPGLMSPVMATLVSSGSAVLACLNGLRPLLKR